MKVGNHNASIVRVQIEGRGLDRGFVSLICICVVNYSDKSGPRRIDGDHAEITDFRPRPPSRYRPDAGARNRSLA
ncbi:hypothetical protein D3C76_1421700 [compost metagenome]